MKNSLFVIGFVFICTFGWSQNNEVSSSQDIFGMLSSPTGSGNVEIYQDASIKKLVVSHIESNSRIDVIDGYRIQLYSGSSKMAKSDAASAKAKFLSAFPDVPVYLEYNAPFWRVRVGDFRSKNESLELYSLVKPMFSESYPVKDSQVNYNRIGEPLKEKDL